MNNSIEHACNIVNELNDIEEISNVISLFLANNTILPGSEQFDEVIDIFGTLVTENIKLMCIDKMKDHIDEF